MIDRLIAPGGRPLRFLIAGAVNTALGLAIYPLLLLAVPTLRVHYLLALGIAQAIGVCFAFLTHKFGVFRTRGNMVREFGAFASFYLANYALNWALLPLLVEVAGIPPIIAQTGFTLLVVIGSYFWHARVSFRPTSQGGQCSCEGRSPGR